jgi:hypothetical protein
MCVTTPEPRGQPTIFCPSSKQLADNADKLKTMLRAEGKRSKKAKAIHRGCESDNRGRYLALDDVSHRIRLATSLGAV